MANKRNTFTDFIAAAECLVAAHYTRLERLAIQGGSARRAADGRGPITCARSCSEP